MNKRLRCFVSIIFCLLLLASLAAPAITVQRLSDQDSDIDILIPSDDQTAAVEYMAEERALTDDYDPPEPTEPPDPTEVDKTALGAMLEEAYKLVKTDYAGASWLIFMDARGVAEAVYKFAVDATQEQVDAVLESLVDAMNNLVPAGEDDDPPDEPLPVDKAALGATLEEADALRQADYTVESWAAFIIARDFAQLAYDDEDATQEEIDLMLENLIVAIANLLSRRVVMPMATSVGTAFTVSQNVILSSATPGAYIYYTLDGSMPTTRSMLYTGAFTLRATTMLRAIAVKDGMDDSAVMTIMFTKSGGTNTNASGSNPRSPSNAAPPVAIVVEPEEQVIKQVSFASFIEGYPNNTFRGRNTMSRQEFVNILYKIKNPDELPKAYPDNPSFDDVAADRWSFDAIEWARETGITEAENGSFRPHDSITRAEIATMLAKLEGWTEMAENIFSDIENHPAYDDILKAVGARVFFGYPDGEFKPDDTATRYELVTTMIRYLLGGEPDDDMLESPDLPFTDLSLNHWAHGYVALAATGVTQ